MLLKNTILHARKQLQMLPETYCHAIYTRNYFLNVPFGLFLTVKKEKKNFAGKMVLTFKYKRFFLVE